MPKPTLVLDIVGLQNRDRLQPIHSQMVALKVKEAVCCELFQGCVQTSSTPLAGVWCCAQQLTLNLASLHVNGMVSASRDRYKK